MREPNQALTLVTLEPALGSPNWNALVMCQTLQGHALFEHRPQLIKPLQPALEVSGYRSALIVVRTFLGIVYFTNGLAKLFGFHDVTIGLWHTFLINRDDALNIQTGNTSSSPGFIHDFGNIVIANWGAFQWLLTLGELAVGLALLLGVLGRLTAIGGFLLAFSTFIFTLGAGTWTFDYLFEPALLVALAIASPPSGLDSRLPWSRVRRG